MNASEMALVLSLGMCSKQIPPGGGTEVCLPYCCVALSVISHSWAGSPSTGKAPRNLPGTDKATEECFVPPNTRLILQPLAMLVGWFCLISSVKDGKFIHGGCRLESQDRNVPVQWGGESGTSWLPWVYFFRKGIPGQKEGLLQWQSPMGSQLL